ncbi:TIGR04222 domain-containing membrane protein [Streptomyces sp. NPDC096152]|uniref:TIGR04222 domain-containing membrane protein n=1 Tax=Streptomyces sp. NPDC096152 TaxID=3366078 RepID=UPI0037F39EE3
MGGLMDGVPANQLGPHEIALLRGGSRAAVQVCVLALHLYGTVGAGRGGTMRVTVRSPGAARELPVLPPLTRAVHAALYRPAGMGQLLQRRGVVRALAALRRDLRAAGLLRAVPPGRTARGRRALRALRGDHPLPAARAGLSPDAVLLAVALYGDRALTSLVPRFTREAGLVGRGGTTERALPESWSGGGGDGVGSGCGTV